MFDIGFWELVVVAVIGLFVLGPERLPGAIRSVQRSIAKVKAFGSKMEAELNHELRVKELHEHLRQIESAADIDKLSPELKRSLAELEQAAASVRSPYAQASEAAANGDEMPAADTQADTAQNDGNEVPSIDAEVTSTRPKQEPK